MKKTKCLATAFFMFVICFHVSGQEKQEIKQQPKNLFKVNLTAIAFKNYSFQYERVINRKISFAIAYRTMPSSSLPFKNTILDASNNNQDTKDAIDALRLSSTAITPEIRFYLSKKGYGRGFYIAPFYRHATFEANNMKFTYTNSLNSESSISLAGKLTANTGGLLFGTQYALGKHVCIDLWFFGPHYGSGIGNFSGTTSTPLTQAEQNDIKQQLEDFDIPLTTKTITVDANGAAIKLDGPWGGIRSGISLGFKF
jgi:hypothetical protein